MGRNAYEPEDWGLATDLYQLTMAAGYFLHGRHERATFELFTRRLPPDRSYLVAAGLATALEYLKNLRFGPAAIEHLRSLPVFAGVDQSFFEYLRGLRFTGEVWALPEGTLAFAHEPLLRVTAPLIEAQLVETFLLATLNFQTLIASKAARVVTAADGRGVIDFGARRAHSMGAAFYGTRASFIGGCIGTSNVEAGRAFEIPVHGTAAHSFIMSFASEREAFEAYAQVFPESTTLLLDTYDTIAATHLATEFGPRLRGVRLDSGDFAALSREVRAILDRAGMNKTKILASGDLNEEKIAALVASGAPIDLFGVGTELATSYDAPALGGVYKLVEIEVAGRQTGKMKLSKDKSTYPFAKQVWRAYADDNSMLGDLIARADEDFTAHGYEPLLVPVMRDGRPLEPPPELRAAQERTLKGLAELPKSYQRLKGADAYPVRWSERLESAREVLSTELRADAGTTKMAVRVVADERE
jgi:nicotinate phosphoribosyltransferase